MTRMESTEESTRLVVIGDLHGKSIWKKIVESEFLSTKEIFIGDYLDGFRITSEEILENFNDILHYKRLNPERVVLLLGNHEAHYLPGFGETYSGFRSEEAPRFGEILEKAIEDGLVQACYAHDDYLFTHAGVTKTWLLDNGCDLQNDNIPIFINRLFLTNRDAFRFNRKDASGVGEDRCQGPFWVRPDSLLLDMTQGYRQVVGHTKVESIVPLKGAPIVVDVLDTHSQYLVINDGKPEVKFV